MQTKEEEPYIDPNPEIKTYKKVNGTLEIETTHKDPVVEIKSHNIEQLQAQIDKIDGVIALWESKRKVYQDIIDIYMGII